MNTEELSNRLTQIVQGITNTHPIRIKATIEVFLEEFDPSQNYLLSISDIEGYETQFIEFEIWDKNDGPIPGIKLFKDLNISHCQTNKPTNQEPIYESEHIIILNSDSTIGCQE